MYPELVELYTSLAHIQCDILEVKILLYLHVQNNIEYFEDTILLLYITLSLISILDRTITLFFSLALG